MANDVAVNQVSFTVQDYSREKSSFTFNAGQAVDNAAWSTALGTFQTSLDAIIDGVIQSDTQFLVNRFSNDPPVSAQSHREKKIVVTYEDDVTLKQYVVNIPTRNDTALVYVPNTDTLDLTEEPLATFVSNFEAIAISPAGNAISVKKAIAVGRNL